MRTKIRQGFAAVGRGLRRLVGSTLALLLSGLRILFGLPRRIWRALIWLLFFLRCLPGRLWRGVKAVVRFVVALPSLPGRAWRWLAGLVRRLRLQVRTWAGRVVHWWQTRILPPRTLSPRTQVLATLTIVIALGALWFLSRELLRSPERRIQTIVYRATPILTTDVPATPTTPTSSVTAPLPSPTPTNALPTSSGGSGALAFALRRDGNTDIYVRKLDDDQLLRLTYDAAEDRDPAWAPDGETLAFASNRGNTWDIYRLDLVSGALLRLTRDPHYDAHPSWSPDGAYVALESYRSGNLDIYIMAADGSEIHELTAHPAADFAPAWSPDGRHIAFVSYRDGSKDIFLYPLDAGTESAVINLTTTPDRDEDAPSWSPDGSRLAFSVGRFTAESIYITTFDWNNKYLDEAQTQLFNPGARPDWSPDGSSVVYEYRRGGQAFLIADSVAGWGAGQEIYSTYMSVWGPSWGVPTVDPQSLAQQRERTALPAQALYIEEILPTPEIPPPFTIVALNDVNGGDDREFLSDRVNDSFEALRQRVLETTGTDYLATIGDSFRLIEVPPPPGQSPRSWNKAGRAFDLNQGLYEREEQLVELVREDIGFRTYWRVYLRVASQDGGMGEPLRDAPWDLKARQQGGLAAREGGELRSEVSPGYYVDFTALAADFGWVRVPANNRWREQWADINWWQFQKPQSLSWLQAMLELYRLDQIEAVFGPVSEQQP